MNPNQIYALISVVFVSALSLAGAFTLALDEKKVKRITLVLVGFAIGALFGDAFIHLIPEAFDKLGRHLTTSLYILAGFFTFFTFERALRLAKIPTYIHDIHPMVPLVLLGDVAHNLIDGMLIGASYLVDLHVGLATTLAIIFHEIPHEIGDFGVLVHGGLSVKRALLLNFLTAVVAIGGTLLSLVIAAHVEGYAVFLLPITAGNFIYVAGSDLIPELHREDSAGISVLQFIAIGCGVGIMALLLLLQ